MLELGVTNKKQESQDQYSELDFYSGKNGWISLFLLLSPNNITWNHELFYGIIDSFIHTIYIQLFSFIYIYNHLYLFQQMSAEKHFKLR